MLKQMTYKEMSDFSNRIYSELHWLKDTSDMLDLMQDRHSYIKAYVEPSSMFTEDREPVYVSTSQLTENSIKLDAIKAIDYRVNLLVSMDSTHGLDIIDEIVKCLPKSAHDRNYCSILIDNYFKGDYFND